MSKTKINDYLHFHLGAEAQVIIDGVANMTPMTITRTLLFDVIFQKKEYGRDIEIKPILRPLSDMTEQEQKECIRISKSNAANDTQSLKIFEQAGLYFEPHVLAHLVKRFDVFGLITTGLAIDKTKT